MPAGTGLLSINRWEESKTTYHDLIFQQQTSSSSASPLPPSSSTSSASSSTNKSEIQREFLRQSQSLPRRLLPIEYQWSLNRFQTLWDTLRSNFEIQLLQERLLRTKTDLHNTTKILASLSKETIKLFTQDTQTYQHAIDKETEQMARTETLEKVAAESERVASKELEDVMERLQQRKEQDEMLQATWFDSDKLIVERETQLLQSIEEARSEILETARVQLKIKKQETEMKEEQNCKALEAFKEARTQKFQAMDLKLEMTLASRTLERMKKRLESVTNENEHVIIKISKSNIELMEVEANINNENKQLEGLESMHEMLEKERNEKEMELNRCKETVLYLPISQSVELLAQKKSDVVRNVIQLHQNEMERMNAASAQMEAKIRKENLFIEDRKRRVDKKTRQCDRFKNMASEIRKDIARTEKKSFIKILEKISIIEQHDLPTIEMKKNQIACDMKHMQQLLSAMQVVDGEEKEDKEEIVAHQRHKELLLSMLQEQRDILAKVVDKGKNTMQQNQTEWNEENNKVETLMNSLLSECKQLEEIIEEKNNHIKEEKTQTFELQEVTRAESKKVREKSKEEEREKENEMKLKEKIIMEESKRETESVLLSERACKVEEEKKKNESMCMKAEEMLKEMQECKEKKSTKEAAIVTIEQEMTKLNVEKSSIELRLDTELATKLNLLEAQKNKNEARINAQHACFDKTETIKSNGTLTGKRTIQLRH